MTFMHSGLQSGGPVEHCSARMAAEWKPSSFLYILPFYFLFYFPPETELSFSREKAERGRECSTGMQSFPVPLLSFLILAAWDP